MSEIPYKIYLEEKEMPTQWYNMRADMEKKPAPILNPGTLKPVTLEELSGIFCEELAKQELDDTSRYFEIPEEIRNFYRMYRPSPLVRAYCLEKKLEADAAALAEEGLLRKEAGLKGRDHRDGSRPVGYGVVHGMFLF